MSLAKELAKRLSRGFQAPWESPLLTVGLGLISCTSYLRMMIVTKIFTLAIECVAGMYYKDEYRFVIQIPTESTLEDLASCILGMIDFDNEHASEFFLANGLRGKKIWLTADGEWDEDDSAMWDRRLSQIFPLPKHKKLFYIYDFGESWSFQITKKGKEMPALRDVEYPCYIEEIGTKPIQYDEAS